ncbi:transmembrane protein 254 isoform X2 [Phyllopteryx taeniolatus]|uniref:transmembrane protein 254 isoform X2 n=1 Tax=Phyllopteryx taeniolatus TaxID=161469 RepID=UPI002AD1E0AA|nr:transmembrane protein 254 isoform X2 [Phyllopteryx taeniolatus]
MYSCNSLFYRICMCSTCKGVRMDMRCIQAGRTHLTAGPVVNRAAAAAAAAMAKSDGSDYFKRASLFWIISVIFGLSYFACIVFAPEIIPYHLLGPFGTFCRYLVDNHAGGLYKGNKGITMPTSCLWFFQTFVFGFASLGLLIRYNPERPKQH